jgi:hypothetical protein
LKYVLHFLTCRDDKWLFWICWFNFMVFLLYFIIMINYNHWFLYVKQTLYSWDVFYLLILFNVFKIEI